MSSNMAFTYSTLPPKSYTRMIRLLPDEDKSALIRCQLCNYNLSCSGGGEHLYEALSYVWGSPVRSHSIIVNGCRFSITESLHTALLHLRDSQLERVLWVDAISIKQDDDNEKSKQIPLMRMIYAQARRVIVWLGEDNEYGEKALEVLGSLGRKGRNHHPGSVDEKDYERCEKLLQRDWFRRIWVLQEVGTAQYISIMCGSVQINGHMFCEGLNKMKPSSALMARISPVSFLIKGALFRSYDKNHSTVTHSIGELVSMYRNHNTTKQHDKVYALLGLSSDINSAALVPDYELPWHEVFRRLTQHVFPKCFVETWCGSETAIVRGKGWILGYIHSVSDSSKDSEQTFSVVFNQTGRNLGCHCSYKWSLQASGELLQGGDIVCLVEGLSEPSILRLCVDYYAVVTPVLKLENDAMVRKSHFMHGLCDLLLVWKVSPSEDKADLQSLSNLIEIAPNYHEEHSEAEQRLNHILSVMVDATMQISDHDRYGKEALHNLLSNGRIKGIDTSCLSRKERYIYRSDRAAIAQALWQQNGLLSAWEEVLGVAVQDYSPCGYIISSILLQYHEGSLPVCEEVVKAAAANAQYGHMIIQQLSLHCRICLPVSEEMIKAAVANNGGHGHVILRFLLNHYRCSLPVSEEVMIAAAINDGAHGDQIMQQLLLKYHDKSLSVSEKVVKAAAANNGGYGSQIMKQLLNTYGCSLPMSEEVVKAAAANNGGYGYQILQQLFLHCGESLPVSEEVVRAAAANNQYGHEIMQQLVSHCGESLPVSEEVVRAAAANAQYGHEIMQQLFLHCGESLPVSEAVVRAAAANDQYGYNIMKQLFLHCGESLPVSEMVVRAAAANAQYGHEIMKQLFLHCGESLPVSEEVVRAAAANAQYGHEIMQQLFLHFGESLPVSEEVVKVAAANAQYGYMIMQQLFKWYAESLPVSEEVVMAAAANNEHGHIILQQLISHCEKSLPVSEGVVKAAVANTGKYGYEIIQQLLNNYGCSLPISEEMVKTAAANRGYSGHEILEQLIKYHGKSLPISEEVVKAAAANAQYGYIIMNQLFLHCGESLPISEEVMIAAATNNGARGDDIIQLLLKYHGKSLSVSEKVVKAAAANNGGYGAQIIEQLLNTYGCSLPVSEEVVKAAANNGGYGSQIMKQLLEHCGESLLVPEEIVEMAAAISSSWSTTEKAHQSLKRRLERKNGNSQSMKRRREQNYGNSQSMKRRRKQNN